MSKNLDSASEAVKTPQSINLSIEDTKIVLDCLRRDLRFKMVKLSDMIREFQDEPENTFLASRIYLDTLMDTKELYIRLRDEFRKLQ